LISFFPFRFIKNFERLISEEANIGGRGGVCRDFFSEEDGVFSNKQEKISVSLRKKENFP
jgi:hypothetical protein